MLSLLVIAGLLITWFVTSGGGGEQDTGGSEGKNPAPSITPGPSDSGPAISEHPGGRDEPSDGASDGEGDTAGDGGGDGHGSADGGAGGDTAGGDGSGAAGGGSQAGGTAGDEVPAGSSLPTCAHGAVRLSLKSVPNSYAPGETPRIGLTAENTSHTDCKLDLGPRHAVLTITRTDGDKEVWASDDCPQDGGSLFLRVPAQDSVTHTVTWNRKPSAPQCATPPATSVTSGTYLVEAATPGFPKTQTSFVLSKD